METKKEFSLVLQNKTVHFCKRKEYHFRRWGSFWSARIKEEISIPKRDIWCDLIVVPHCKTAIGCIIRAYKKIKQMEKEDYYESK